MALGEIVLAILSSILLVLGYLFTLGLLCVPFFRLKALSMQGDGVDHMPVLYLMSLTNALAWFSYGFLDPRSYAVILINLIGFLVHFVYTVWYMVICVSKSCRVCTGFWLVVILLSFGSVASFHGLFPHLLTLDRDKIGKGVMITAGLMYLGPFPDTLMALGSGNPESISVPIIFVSFGNAFFWGEYGRATSQGTICMPNELGMIIPFLQLLAYVWIRWNDRGLFWEEIQQFFQQITVTVSQALREGYASLRGEEVAD